MGLSLEDSKTGLKEGLGWDSHSYFYRGPPAVLGTIRCVVRLRGGHDSRQRFQTKESKNAFVHVIGCDEEMKTCRST